MDPLITCQDVAKVYKLYHRPGDRVVEFFFRKPRHREVKALDGVTFSLERGKSLGLVGVNGAGKSTLLKILANTTHPTKGQVKVNGRVAAILELGMGFHGEFSGWDNAILNATLLGLSKKELEHALPQIAEFSELGEFLNHPVKTYSSGMVMRLAFAVATHVDPDILIIDEALAVGDGYFQKKCVDKIRSFKERGKTILLCSHALYYIAQLCDAALWIHDGRIQKEGKADEVVHDYELFLLQQEEKDVQEKKKNSLPAFLKAVTWRYEEEQKRLSLNISWQTKDPALAFKVGFVLDHASGLPLFSTLMEESVKGKKDYTVQLEIEETPFQKGEYDFVVFLMDEAGLTIYDEWRERSAWKITPTEYPVGLLSLPHRWSYKNSLSM